MSKRCQWTPRVLGSVEWHKGHVTSVGKTLLGTWLRFFFKQWGDMKKMSRDDNARKTWSIVEDMFGEVRLHWEKLENVECSWENSRGC
jgi:hypothetical protein